MNRFVWDLHATAPSVLRHEYPISALFGNTPALPLGALVTPGEYRVRITANGKTYEQPLTVTMDPRVDVSLDALNQEFQLETKIIEATGQSFEFYRKALQLRQTLAAEQKQLERKPQGTEAAIAAIKSIDQKALRLQGSDSGRGGGGRGGQQTPAFAALNRDLGSLASMVDGQDAAPTPVMDIAYDKYCHDLASAAPELE